MQLKAALRHGVAIRETLLLWKWLDLRPTGYLDLVMLQVLESVKTGIERFV